MERKYGEEECRGRMERNDETVVPDSHDEQGSEI